MIHRISLMLTIFILLPVMTSHAHADTWEAFCIRVMDGDRIVVDRHGRAVNIRLNAVDAPEIGQPYGADAKRFTSVHVLRKRVRIDALGKDRYGRTIANVFVGKLCVNTAIVKDGFAWWFRRFSPHNDELRDLEEEARKAKRGLWAQTDPVPPWEWRKGHR